MAARSPPAPVPPGAEPGGERAGRIRHHVLAGHAHHQHQAARPRARQRGDGPGPAGRRLRVGRRASATPSRCFPARWPTGSTTRDPSTPRPSRRAASWPTPTSAGRPAEAIALYERTVDDSERHARSRPPGHPGRPGQPGRHVPDRRTAQGSDDRLPDAPDRRRTPARRGAPHHADHPRKPGRRLPGQRATQGGDRAVRAACATVEADGGRDHPDTIAARASLASAYRSGGKQKDAIAQYERVLADRERIAGRRSPGHDRGPGQPGLRLPQRGTAAGGDPALRAHAGRPEASPGTGPPGHPVRTVQPGRALPASPPDARRHPPLRARAGRQRADARARRPGDADHPVQPRHGLLADGRLTEPSRCCSRPWPTPNATWVRTTR